MTVTTTTMMIMEKTKGAFVISINNAEKSIKADIGINNRINSDVSKIWKQEDKQDFDMLHIQLLPLLVQLGSTTNNIQHYYKQHSFTAASTL